jgi:haloalkane dehalogenase
VIAPDLIGFGRSDKPADRAEYSYERNVAWLSSWLLAMDLQQVTLCCQDWGGLLGLRLVAAFPDRFCGVVAANTTLPTGEPLNAAFMQWLAFSQSHDDLPVGQIIAMGSDRKLSPAELAAYDAPFPDARYKAAVCQFPTLVPITAQHPSVAENRAAWAALAQFNKPFVTAFSDNDAVTRGKDLPMQTLIPGARGQPHSTLKGAHFLQEDSPEALAAVIEALLARGSRSAANAQ